MRRLKTIPKNAGWRWYETSDGWVPAKIKRFAGDGLMWCPWDSRSSFSNTWRHIHSSDVYRWGEPIGRVRRQSDIRIPYRVTKEKTNADSV